MSTDSPIIIATRGSTLALAQASLVHEACRTSFPEQRFEVRTFKTTGDRTQTEAPQPSATNLKAQFTKEIEEALLRRDADLAVHSMKDLPVALPEGLVIGAVPLRADPRDVLVLRQRAYRNHNSKSPSAIDQLTTGATVATGSVRRRAQLLSRRPDLQVVPIRGNVGTRLRKLAENPDLEATLLGAAGFQRLGWQITADGTLHGQEVPKELAGTPIAPEIVIPCVGQGAIAVEVREDDERTRAICHKLNHFESMQCVLAERAFLRAVGGDCQSPMAAYADIETNRIRMRAGLFSGEEAKRANSSGAIEEPEALGKSLASKLMD